VTIIPLFPHKEQIPRPNGGAADGTEGRDEPASLGAKHESTGARIVQGAEQALPQKALAASDQPLPVDTYTTHAIVIEHRGEIR
jgi:hypothetical protein